MYFTILLLTGGAVLSRGCSCLQGVQLSQLHQPSGRCILIGAIYSVGAVETTAPPNCTP